MAARIGLDAAADPAWRERLASVAVAAAFFANYSPDTDTIAHVDGNPANCHVTNLHLIPRDPTRAQPFPNHRASEPRPVWMVCRSCKRRVALFGSV